MALEDRGISGEQYVEMTCGAENLSPFSSPAGYTEPPSYYLSDYEWQQQQHVQSSQHPPLQHQQQIEDSDRVYYTTYTDGSDLGTHGYPHFGHQAAVHPEFYPQTPNVWPANSSPDPLVPGQLTPHQRYFSGIDLSQQGSSQQANSATGPNGKPKRKRVQSHSQRKAANVRERRRMFHLNEAFDELRKRLPAFNYEKRLSRIETLRLAMTYISFMKEVSTGCDPKCVKLKPHGSDLSPLPRNSDDLLSPHHHHRHHQSSYSGSDNNDDNHEGNDDSDCSNDELSNHSGGN